MSEGIELTPIPKDSDHMTIEEFVECCQSRSFIDYDGFGEWATKDEVMSGNPADWVSPSEIVNGLIPPKWATHIVWYNR
jgi:hypothetical protein